MVYSSITLVTYAAYCKIVMPVKGLPESFFIIMSRNLLFMLDDVFNVDMGFYVRGSII